MNNDTIEAEAAREVAASTPACAPTGITEYANAEKTRVGISREQAIEILTHQAAEDAEVAQTAKATKPKK